MLTRPWTSKASLTAVYNSSQLLSNSGDPNLYETKDKAVWEEETRLRWEQRVHVDTG